MINLDSSCLCRQSDQAVYPSWRHAKLFCRWGGKTNLNQPTRTSPYPSPPTPLSPHLHSPSSPLVEVFLLFLLKVAFCDFFHQAPRPVILAHLPWSSGHDFRLSIHPVGNKRGRPGFDSPRESHTFCACFALFLCRFWLSFGRDVVIFGVLVCSGWY